MSLNDACIDAWLLKTKSIEMNFRNHIHIAVTAVVLSSIGFGVNAQQSKLPPCVGTDYSKWTNCIGTLASPGGKIVGEWKNGKPNGQSTGTFASGDSYVGEMKDGKINGKGTFTFANGNRYVGEFKDELRTGQGTFTFANGDKYVGEWKDDERTERGTHTYANGSKYVGEWKNNKRIGQGTYTFADGGKYVGEWKDNKQSGKGTLAFANGSKYVGEWKEGKRSGQGTFTFSTGKYAGEWKDDVANGKGIEYSAAGEILYSGLYKDGNRVENKQQTAQAAPAKLPTRVKRISECVVLNAVMASYLIQAGEKKMGQAMQRQGVTWGRSALEIGKREGVTEQEIVKENKRGSEAALANMSSYMESAQDKMKACALLLKSDSELLQVFQSNAR